MLETRWSVAVLDAILNEMGTSAPGVKRHSGVAIITFSTPCRYKPNRDKQVRRNQGQRRGLWGEKLINLFLERLWPHMRRTNARERTFRRRIFGTCLLTYRFDAASLKAKLKTLVVAFAGIIPFPE
jgi:hypothetical protein